MALTEKLTAIADAIRGKTGGTEEMTLDAMVSAIEGITGGGVKYVTGSFVAINSNTPTITHNLNSNKVLVICAIHEMYATLTSQRKAIMCVSFSSATFPTRTIDLSPYHPNFGIVEINLNNKANGLLYRTAASSYNQDCYDVDRRHEQNNDPNTFVLPNYQGYEAGVTYSWIAYDLGTIGFPWL